MRSNCFQLPALGMFMLVGATAGAQTMQWEDYEPVSTLKVEQTELTSAIYPFVDAHAHQRRLSGERIQGIIADMDAMNMAVMVNLSGGSGEQLRSMVDATEEVAPGRIVHFANVNFSRVSEPGFGETAAAQLEEDVSNGARGLKIYKSLGMYTQDAEGNRLATDDPRLDPIWAKCGELGIPVLIHTADPSQFWLDHDQYNERWFELKQRPERKRPSEPSFEALIEEQWNVFRRHPNTLFINAHLGWMGNDLSRLGELLDANTNVYTELGAVVAELGRQPHTAREWLIEYQDRVHMGKDSWAPEEYYTYFRVLETDDEFFPYYRKRHAWWTMYGLNLPDEVLRKVYYKNAVRLIPGLDKTLFPDDWNIDAVAAPDPRPSPLMLARASVGDTYIKVHYSSPRKRGREIFGGLVPFGELWRTAANEASEITTTGQIVVQGQELAAGTYSVFSIPDQESWTVIFNKGLGQNGTQSYDPDMDALRVEVPAEVMDEVYEAFTIRFEEEGETTTMILAWDRTRVALDIGS